MSCDSAEGLVQDRDPAAPQNDAITIAAVLTTYNSGAFLEEALATVVAQTRPPDEILIIDDGSTDDTAARMERWAGRVRYCRQENAGASAARNAGLRATHSSWIAYLDADDLWPPERLERQEHWLRDHPEAGVVFGLVQNFVQPGCEAGFDPVRHHLNQWLPGMIPSSGLFGRSALERVGGFDAELRTAEIVDLIIRLREAEVELSMPDFPVVRRRLHGANKRLTHENSIRTDLRLLRGFIARKRARQAPP